MPTKNTSPIVNLTIKKGILHSILCKEYLFFLFVHYNITFLIIFSILGTIRIPYNERRRSFLAGGKVVYFNE